MPPEGLCRAVAARHPDMAQPMRSRSEAVQHLAPDTNSLDMTARLASILNQDTAFGIRIASLYLHLLNASNAGD
jgi:hypothetical protein